MVAREFDGSQEQVVEAAVRKGVKFVYFYRRPPLELANVPYGPLPWVEFEDDLITRSFRYFGLVVVVDHADILCGKDLTSLVTGLPFLRSSPD